MFRRLLRKRLNASGLKNVNMVRYELHLFGVRLANRIWPSAIARMRELRNRSSLLMHWGCGPRRLPGWWNVDGWKTEATDHVHDLRNRLPLNDGSVELIFTEHVLEHIEYNIAERILADFHRILTSRGRIRIIVPGLSQCCEAFMRGDAEWFSKVDTQSETAGLGFNRIFYSHFHRHIYDFETLEHLLRKVGFSEVIESSHLSSSDPRLNIDSDNEPRKLVSLYVEAVKG